MENNLVIGFGGPNDKLSLPLSTRRGTHIPNKKEEDQSLEQLEAGRAMWHQMRPNARIRSLTRRYNCMGLIFAARRTCIEIEHLPWILKEDDYRQLASRDELRVGDIVVYSTPKALTHVGLVYEVPLVVSTIRREIVVLSKWGRDGEYFHEIDYVPEIYGKPLQFWTDRKRT